MLIGSDYPKIEFQLFGLDLLEPNGFVGNSLIFIFSLIFYFKTKRLQVENHVFYRNWRLFFIFFGFTFFFGGLSHLLFHYFGINGKFLSWYLGIFAPYFIEQAMLSIFPDENKRKLFRLLSICKLILFLVIELYVMLFVDLSNAPEKGLLIPSLATATGLILGMGVLGIYYQRIYHQAFKYLVWSVLILFISTIPQMFKINIYPLFDRNDLSHFLLIVTLFFYFQCLKQVKAIQFTK